MKGALDRVGIFSIKPIYCVAFKVDNCDNHAKKVLESVFFPDLKFSAEVIDYLSVRVRRDFFSIKKTLQDFDKFLYSEKKQPTKISAASFLKSYLN